jgi:hypothetical protein
VRGGSGCGGFGVDEVVAFGGLVVVGKLLGSGGAAEGYRVGVEGDVVGVEDEGVVGF